MRMKRVNFYLSEKHIEALEEYARHKNLLATTGRKVGEPDKSAALRIAIEYLTAKPTTEAALPAPSPQQG